ncbi:MAG: NYN domain-containing protein [candidate division Zixibacteria bacterium]|nr:NYN domain-containing protein [candidate division Zixibacteria bacterium]
MIITGKPHRAIAFIDGFNVYHFLENNFPQCKWLDYRKLAQRHLPQYATLTEVYYFSAYATWDQKKVERHQKYVEALRAIGIRIEINHFANRRRNFVVPDKLSGKTFNTIDGPIRGIIRTGYTFEEKSTDVSIGAHIIALAAKNEFDTALLISGDTDFVPVIKIMNSSFSPKILRIAVPSFSMPGPFTQLLPNGFCRLITKSDLTKSLMDSPITGTSISKPPEW